MSEAWQTLAREAIHAFTHDGGCGECGCRPHAPSCWVGRFEARLLEEAPSGVTYLSVRELRDRLSREIDEWPPYGTHVRQTLASVIHELDRLLRIEDQHAAALPAAPAEAWQPIETAPKMRTILLFAVTDVDERGVVKNWKMATGSYHEGYEDARSKAEGISPWKWDGHQLKVYEIHPTHWAALPAAPEPESKL